MSNPAVSPSSDRQPLLPTRYRFEFEGTGGSFFLIFLKNILLTLLTLGVYLAWGKTERRKYVWNNMTFHQQHFRYTGTGMEKQLAAAAREFFADRKHFRIDAGSTTVHASMLLKWFVEDFGGSAAKLLVYARRWITDPVRLTLLARPGLTIEWLEYDWSINEQKRPAKPK